MSKAGIEFVVEEVQGQHHVGLWLATGAWCGVGTFEDSDRAARVADLLNGAAA